MPVVLIEKQTPQITVLTLNRPERRNALSLELLTELTAAIKVASEQPQERILILHLAMVENARTRPDDGLTGGAVSDAEAGCEDREQDKESDDDERFHGPIIGQFSS